IKPQEGKGEPPLRWNWDSPLIISPHSHTRLYFAANILFRSDDRGDTWKKVSGELSRALDRNKLPVMGRIWGPEAVAKNASTALYGNASALAESTKKEGLIVVGTDDGLVQITENGGQSWRKIDKFPGVPENSYVAYVLPSQHDVNTLYIVFNNHQNADFAPYILKSTDLGKSWNPLKSNLPANSPLWVVAEDHVNPNLLFLGTEFGLWFSIDGGQKWVRLKGNFPTIAVRDLSIQKHENDLVVATFGRGIYILDDYTPLRLLQPEMLNQEANLFPVAPAQLFIPATPLGGGGRGMQGESLYVAPNPQFGATFTIYLKDPYRTKRQQRQMAAREAQRKNQPIEYPSVEQLRAEDEEEAPSLFLTITDAQGNVVRRLPANNAPGMQRVTWDLRFPANSLTGGGPPRQEGDEPPTGPQQPPSSTLVMPGTYKVTLSKRVGGETKQIAGPVTFEVVVEGTTAMSDAERKALAEFQQQVSKLQRAVIGALDIANSTRTKLGLIRRAIQEAPGATDKMREEAQAIEKKLNQILIALRGDTTLRQRNEGTPPSISERVNGIVGGQRLSTAKPTQTHRDAYRIAAEEFAAELAKLRALVESDVAKLEKQLEAVGAPYTPGRLPEWKQ
ncbi:MAG TPA: glycosyl hydrolase, partial [Candidatus Nitrosotenuis sp.]|nr:glycosyl hydrolase [Candidatus Nitrosotenuis sp.]